MNINETTKTTKNSFTFAGLGLAGVAIFAGLLISVFPSHRQYFPAKVSDSDNDMGAKGMEQFFFTARRDINTNAMDYKSMLAADIADRAMTNVRRTHAVTVPGFNWITMGPTNVGGRTRAILIDNTDPTHQTVFAGGISGGIWKSTNGGGTWDNASAALSFSLNDTLSNMNICCLAQDKNGALYAGTGEGFTAYGSQSEFSSGELGGGIFKSTDDGKTWRLLASTKPNPIDNYNVKWSYVNRIAIRPDSFQVIYAATNLGLMVSHDSGAHWNTAIKSGTNTPLNSNSLDIKISSDGSIVIACINGYGWYCYPQTANSNAFTEIKANGAGHLNGNAARIEFAISPTNANRIYASVIQSNSLFGTGGNNSGIFMTTTAVSSGTGGYWHEIGPGGSFSFDPYAEPSPTTDDQATYDNTLGVPPANEAQLLCGGTTLWEWSGNTLTDTVGSWYKVSHYSAYYNGDPLWIHADEHTIVFDNNNPTVFYIGCDGGIFKCSNYFIDPTNVDNTIGRLSIQPINRNYNVTQYYTVSFSPEVNYTTVDYNNSSVVEGLGCGGGTQDNGSPYINGNAFPHYPNDGYDLSGGDGAGSTVSQLDPNIAYFCSDYGSFLREGNLGALSSPTSAYTQTKGYDLGGNIDSVYQAVGPGATCFVFPCALYENAYDLLNKDSLQFISDKNYAVGDTIWPTAANAQLTYPYKLTKALAIGDTLKVPDRVVSRLAIGFAPSKGGVWITGQGASNNSVIWMPIAMGALSNPVALSDGAAIHALAWSGDGNTLYLGTEDGALYTLTNINSVIANNYKSGALWSNGGSRGIVDTTNQVVSASLTAALNAGGRDILSISVDQNNPSNVLVTAGNYNNTIFVYYSNNATSPTPTFTSVQGNLPAMPVYSSILDLMDSTGHWVPNSAMVGTEHGIYSTTNITKAGGPVWVKNNSGMANVMTLALKQQTTPNWLCNNTGVIYAGTHGRGIWSTNNFHNIGTGLPSVSTAVKENTLLVYPNPMTSLGNIQFNLAAAGNVTITIYDMQGREVKTISMGAQATGSHTVNFAANDLREGTYFAALTGDNFRKVSKFVVVK